MARVALVWRAMPWQIARAWQSTKLGHGAYGFSQRTLAGVRRRSSGRLLLKAGARSRTPVLGTSVRGQEKGEIWSD